MVFFVRKSVNWSCFFIYYFFFFPVSLLSCSSTAVSTFSQVLFYSAFFFLPVLTSQSKIMEVCYCRKWSFWSCISVKFHLLCLCLICMYFHRLITNFVHICLIREALFPDFVACALFGPRIYLHVNIHINLNVIGHCLFSRESH